MLLWTGFVFEHKTTAFFLFLNRDEENLKLTIIPEELCADAVDEISELIHEAYPEFWSVVIAEGIVETFEEAFLVGGRREGKLMTFGKAVCTPPVSYVVWIATLEDYRN